MMKISKIAETNAGAPTFINFRTLNSRPSENIKKITPSCENI